MTLETNWCSGLRSIWPLMPIKHGFALIGSGTTPTTEKTGYYGGDIPWVTTSELRENRITETAQKLTDEAVRDFSSLRMYGPDSILFAMYGATIGRVASLGIAATVNQAVCALSHPTRFLPAFASYALQASRDYLVSIASGGGQPNLNAAKLRDHPLPCPPFTAQKPIVAYLDAQTAEIDALIAEKERMLALLEEQRSAVVTHAVTRGLDPNAPLKPSGLEWVGEIPKHWPIMRLKHFARIGNGSTPNRDNPEYWEGGEYPWLNSSVVGDRTVREESRFVTDIALQECHLPRIEPPVLLVAITGQGKTRGRSTVLSFEATINQHLAFVKPIGQAADCLYLSFLMDTAYSFIRSDSEGAGSTRGAITCEQLGSFRIPLPPLGEQQAILEAIRFRTKRFESLQESTSDSISLLNERRSALITAAVTGQIPIEEMHV